MDVRLNPDIEQIVSHKVAGGEYTSASDVMNAAVRLLEQRDQVKENIRGKIAAGMASIRAGRVTDGEDFMAVLMADLDDTDDARE